MRCVSVVLFSAPVGGVARFARHLALSGSDHKLKIPPRMENESPTALPDDLTRKPVLEEPMLQSRVNLSNDSTERAISP